VRHDLDIRWDTASERNMRAVNADAVATRRDPASGHLVFAVADGIGDSPGSAEAARRAVAAAVATPVEQGTIQAVLAAQQALLFTEDARSKKMTVSSWWRCRSATVPAQAIGSRGSATAGPTCGTTRPCGS
jgi:hypothetical protein